MLAYTVLQHVWQTVYIQIIAFVFACISKSALDKRVDQRIAVPIRREATYIDT